MNNIKVNLIITLPGGVMMSEKECSKNPTESYNVHTMIVTDENRHRERIEFKTRKSKPALKKLSISEEAYNAMVDPDNIPSWMPSVSSWKLLNKNQRLIKHLFNICQNEGGESFTFSVNED